MIFKNEVPGHPNPYIICDPCITCGNPVDGVCVSNEGSPLPGAGIWGMLEAWIKFSPCGHAVSSSSAQSWTVLRFSSKESCNKEELKRALSSLRA